MSHRVKTEQTFECELLHAGIWLVVREKTAGARLLAKLPENRGLSIVVSTSDWPPRSVHLQRM